MVNVIVAADSRYSVNREALQEAARVALESHNVRGNVEMEVNIVGDRKMHELNKAYRGLDYAADILTFAMEDPNPQNVQRTRPTGFVASPDKVLRLGSILISYPKAVENAAMEQKSVEEEICFLMEHGINHLLGIHHG